MNNQTYNIQEYLISSIVDIQGTIRALDSKVGIIFVILSIPFGSIGKIYNTCKILLLSGSKAAPYFNIHLFLIFIFLILWILAFICAVRAVISIENPSEHIVNSGDYTGFFYCGGMYQFGLLDSFFNRKNIKAVKDVKKHVDSLPISQQQINEELAFEQMKLAYIRDVKSIRQKWAYRFTILWLLDGCTIYFLSRI
jgi:hypothetical protein